MKSLVEEASSITKAIEKAWTRAGKPQSFSVKIFENPEVGFLGLTTKKSAKVGIFFEEVVIDKTSRNHNNKPAQAQDRAQDSRPHNKEYTPRQDNKEPRPDRRQDSRERGPRQHSRPNNRPQQDRGQSRDNRPAHPRHRDQDSSNAAPRTPRNHAPAHTDRPESPERYKRPEQQEAPQERAHVVPAPQQQAPVKPLDVTIPVNAPTNIKRAPKISGRRFVAPKKDDESNKS